MAEARDPSSSETRAHSSDFPLHNDVVALRARGERWPSPIQSDGLTDGTDGIAVCDREIRTFCRRLLGSCEAQSALVDDAVDGLLDAVVRGRPIALRGASDLVPVAYALHRRILGAERPFVVCDPRRREGE